MLLERWKRNEKWMYRTFMHDVLESFSHPSNNFYSRIWVVTLKNFSHGKRLLVALETYIPHSLLFNNWVFITPTNCEHGWSLRPYACSFKKLKCANRCSSITHSRPHFFNLEKWSKKSKQVALSLWLAKSKYKVGFLQTIYSILGTLYCQEMLIKLSPASE